MARYYNPTTKKITDVQNPDLNPDLIVGNVLLSDEQSQSIKTDASGSIISGGTITGDLLNPVTGLNYTSPASTPASPVTVPPPAPLGKEQTKESDLSTEIQRLTDIIGGTGDLVGKEELRNLEMH